MSFIKTEDMLIQQKSLRSKPDKLNRMDDLTKSTEQIISLVNIIIIYTRNNNVANKLLIKDNREIIHF